MNKEQNKKIIEKGEINVADFPNLYEKVVTEFAKAKVSSPSDLLKRFIGEELLQLLKEKRKYGLNKYGESSFQSNLHNALNSPTLEHIEDELIDAMNYTLHEGFKSNFLYPNKRTKLSFVFDKLLEAYVIVKELQEPNG
jgi:hypothetical protein